MTPQTQSVKLTYEDFLNFPDDGRRHELIDGEHYVTPSPNTRHQVIVGNLHWLIRRYLEGQPEGRVFLAPFDVVFSDTNVTEPDLLYVSSGRAKIVTDKHVRGAPDLVIEVLSPATRRTDKGKKLEVYERFGVQEYWLADPESEVITIHRRKGTSFQRTGELSRENDDALTSPLFPSLTLPLTDIFDDN